MKKITGCPPPPIHPLSSKTKKTKHTKNKVKMQIHIDKRNRTRERENKEEIKNSISLTRDTPLFLNTYKHNEQKEKIQQTDNIEEAKEQVSEEKQLISTQGRTRGMHTNKLILIRRCSRGHICKQRMSRCQGVGNGDAQCDGLSVHL